jgi:hypothetical protein
MYEIKANTRRLDTTQESKISMASPLMGARHSKLAPTDPEKAMTPPTQKLT